MTGAALNCSGTAIGVQAVDVGVVGVRVVGAVMVGVVMVSVLPRRHERRAAVLSELSSIDVRCPCEPL